jgi:hypothetical protein
MSSTPDVPDARLLEAHDLALAALREITPEATIGEPAGYAVEADGVVSLRFATRLAGYPGWFWTVSLAAVGDEEPTVLEAELLPGDDALLAPEWTPWAVRLADYQAQQAALAQVGVEAIDEDDLDEDSDDEPDEDDEDDDEPGSRLHAGDVDGVDIDELDGGDEDDFDDDADDEDDDVDGADDEDDLDADDLEGDDADDVDDLEDGSDDDLHDRDDGR